MVLIVIEIADAMICEACLPNGWARFQTIRKSSLNELHGAFQRDLWRGSQQRVDVVGHDYKFVEKKFLFVAIVCESFNQKSGRCVFSEDRKALSGNSRDEECAAAFHWVMVVGIVTDFGERRHNLSWEFQNGIPGLKARSYVGRLTRPLRGRSSTGASAAGTSATNSQIRFAETRVEQAKSNEDYKVEERRFSVAIGASYERGFSSKAGEK